MTLEEIKSVYIDQFTMLQEIKAANEGHYLEYKIKTISFKEEMKKCYIRRMEI